MKERKNMKHDDKKENSEESWGDQAKKKFQNTVKKAKTSKQLDELYNFTNTNTEGLIAFILLVVGVITLFINEFVGSLIIGAVAGYFYSGEVIYFFRTLPAYFHGHEKTRHIVFVVLLVGLLLTSPAFFIGGILAAIITEFLYRSK
jgi:hypothetical protein